MAIKGGRTVTKRKRSDAWQKLTQDRAEAQRERVTKEKRVQLGKSGLGVQASCAGVQRGSSMRAGTMT